jgi:hypothetical protein
MTAAALLLLLLQLPSPMAGFSAPHQLLGCPGQRYREEGKACGSITAQCLSNSDAHMLVRKLGTGGLTGVVW